MRHEGKSMTYYMEVTTDRYSLPVAVAESISELARLRRVDKSTICRCIKVASGKRPTKYIKVEVSKDV